MKKALLLFFISFLFNYANNVFGYTFNVTNLIGEDVKIRLYWRLYIPFVTNELKELNDKNELIEDFQTSRISITGEKMLNCLASIKVFTKQEGRWFSQNAPIYVVPEGQFESLRKSGGIIESMILQISDWWDELGCGNRDLILVTDPDSGRILALTS